jgi:hypothetical protein
MSVKMRQEVERKIATAFIKSALEAGYMVSVDNGDSETHRMSDVSSILKEMFLTDDEHLYLSKDGKGAGWVHLVYGNDGWDVISDYTTNLESLMGPANKIANYYED